MYISRLKLRNWRNFRDVDIRLSERVFLIGPNASGKSNMLDALRFLRDIAKSDGGGLDRAISQRGGLSRIRCLAARREPDVELEVEVAESAGSVAWKYAIGLTQQVRGRRQPLLRYERAWKGDEQVLNRPDTADKKDELRLTQTHLEQISANASFRGIAGFLESIRYLHLVPQLVRNPQAYPGLSGEDPYGRNFLEIVAKTPERTRRGRLTRIEGALRKAVPQLKNLIDTKDETGVPHLEAIYEHWRPNAGRQREDQFSDGTLRLIGLFWSLLDGTAPLLLEEPELSLNARIVEKLPTLIASLQRKTDRQVIVSTHSEQMLQDKGIAPEEAILLTPGKDGTSVQRVSDNPELRVQLNPKMSIADVVLPYAASRDMAHLGLFE